MIDFWFGPADDVVAGKLKPILKVLNRKSNCQELCFG
jgi:hypothetical protein